MQVTWRLRWKIIIILKQTELWYRNSIGIGRYPNSGIGIGSEVKKCGSVHPYFQTMLPAESVLIEPLQKHREAFLISVSWWEQALKQANLFLCFCLFVPCSRVSGPSQPLPQLLCVLFVSGSGTGSGLSSGVNNTKTWCVTSVWLWLIVLLARPSVTRAVWEVSADSGTHRWGCICFILSYLQIFQSVTVHKKHRRSVSQHCGAPAEREIIWLAATFYQGAVQEAAALLVNKSFAGALWISYEPKLEWPCWCLAAVYPHLFCLYHFEFTRKVICQKKH